MRLFLNQLDLPFQVGQQVFIRQSLLYWTDNLTRTVPYFSGVIQSIEIIINPKSRRIWKESQQHTLDVDMIRYEVLPHSHFNPFGLVQIFDQVEMGSKLFPSEQALLAATENEPSVYHVGKEELYTIGSL